MKKQPDYCIVRLPQSAHKAAREHCNRHLLLMPAFLRDAVAEKLSRDKSKPKASQ